MKDQGDPRMGSETRIGDVAQAAGVSIRTVSRVLNKSPKVNAATRAKIEQA
ncbi:LacI family DNA-binding transcriptional regulator, partial [Novosphingobium profundi]|uniref:LacI family DNA-binding transcriptional regulator n=1 Tax=Novosphingobium profundi TaxID=1774954 RepID=UPI001BDB272C